MANAPDLGDLHPEIYFGARAVRESTDPIWTISAPRGLLNCKQHARFFRTKYKWLSSLLERYPGCLLYYDEVPQDSQIAGKWINVWKHFYIIPDIHPTAARALRNYLYYGSWEIFHYNHSDLTNPIEVFPRRARTTGEFVARLRALGIDIYLGSHPDDDPWEFYLSEARE